jgi:hypothetical protein
LQIHAGGGDAMPNRGEIFLLFQKKHYFCVSFRERDINDNKLNTITMQSFVNAVGDFFLKEKGISISNVGYMEMPKEREKYNLSKTIGNANLTEERFKTESEADSVKDEFLSMPLP